MVWRDSVGVKSSGSGLKSKIRVRGYFSSEPDLWLLRHADEPKDGETNVYGYNPALF